MSVHAHTSTHYWTDHDQTLIWTDSYKPELKKNVPQLKYSFIQEELQQIEEQEHLQVPAWLPTLQPRDVCLSLSHNICPSTTLPIPITARPTPLHPPKHYLHWAWHRALQLIQQALHTGTHIFDPTPTISLWFFFCRGCSLPPCRAAALWDNIVRSGHVGQWWASADFIFRTEEQSCSDT